MLTGAVVVLWAAALVWLGHARGWWWGRSPALRWTGPDRQCLALLWGGSRVGWVRSDRVALPGGGWQVLTDAKLAITAVGAAREVAVDGEVSVEADNTLRSFRLEVRVGEFPFVVSGERQGDEFVIRQGAAPLWSERRLDASVAAHIGVADPLVGLGTVLPPEGGTVRYLNPLTLEVETARITLLGPDTVSVRGVTVRTRLLEVDSFGLRSHCWVDEEGGVLRARTALGLEAIAVSCDDAVSRSLRPVEPMRVTTEGTVPTGAGRVVLRMAIPEELKVGSHRQFWTGDTLVSRAEQPPAPGTVEADTIYLDPSPMVESDHPAIIAKAREVAGKEPDPFRKAILILQWVHRYLDKQLMPAVPSALGALRSATGDCNEHAALFVAMCRAAGVPADIRAGLAYLPGRGFGYHAWVAVHTSRWVEMDPTWGEELVDASHISLIEGTPEEHVDLALAGDLLAVRVLEAE
jgi:hypothetical protein